MNKILILIITLLSFTGNAQIKGEKPNDFILQCPTKYKLDGDISKFFYKYSARTEDLIVHGGEIEYGYYKRYFNFIPLINAFVLTLDFGVNKPDITIHRETLKISSPWNDGQGQCELVTNEFFNKTLEEWNKKEEMAKKEKERWSKEQQEKNKI